MFSKILTKLIDQAILPAILVLAVRVVSVVLVSHYFNTTFTFDASGFSFINEADYITVNSYSTFIMVAILAIGLFYILLKSHIFHDSHVTPATTAKLFSMRMPSFIQTSFDIYSQAVVWLSYAYLLTIVAGIMAYFGLLLGWVFFSSLTLVVIATVLMVFDIEHEMKLVKEKGQIYDEDTEFVEESKGKKDK
jgi:hypothetical protein